MDMRKKIQPLNILLAFMLSLATGVMATPAGAQEVAFARVPQDGNTVSQPAGKRELKSVLSEIESKQHVYFSYNSHSLKNKYVAIQTNGLNRENLEKYLAEAIAPLGLKIERLKDNQYLIYAKNNKRLLREIKNRGIEPSGDTTRQALLDPLPGFVETTPSAPVTLSGKVTSDTGEELPGVSVVLKGTTTGTATGPEGNYTLTVPDGDGVLVFSFIGYVTREVPIGGRTRVDLSLTPDIKSLQEVVVVGYGPAQNRRDITGSVSSVNVKELEGVPMAGIDALIQGRVPGVQVIQNSGTPGGGVTVRIRGTTSISSGNDPLYVVDGIPIATGDFSEINAGQQGTNALADINPTDIESIEILKDASASAIYGARAANGVVLITTRRGKSGKTRVTANVSHGVQQLGRKMEMLSSRELVQLFYDQTSNANQNLPIFLQDTAALYDPRNQTDWQEELFRPAPITTADLSFRGGEAKLRFAVTLGYFGQEGIVINSGFKRLASRINLDYEVNKKLRIGNSLSFTRTDNQRITSDNNEQSVLTNSIRMLPFVPVYNPDGSYNFTTNTSGSFNNPIALANGIDYNSKGNRLLGSIHAEYDIIEGLTFRTQWSVDLLNQRDNRFVSSVATERGERRASAAATQNLSWTNSNTLSYKRTFNQDHEVSVLVGYEQQEIQRESNRSETSGHSSDDITTVNGGPILETATSERRGFGIESLFGRINYGFKDKYLFTANVRRDASSKFGRNNRYGVFPSASVGWRISSEPFMQNVRFISDLKLRGSVGATGNQDIPEYATRGLFVAGRNYVGFGGVFPTEVANPDLRWESTTQYNVALDFAVLNNRITFVAEAYLKRTKDLLILRSLPQPYGINNVWRNDADTENRGLEFGINSNNLVGNFKWESNFNISFNRNKILKFGDSFRSTVARQGFNINGPVSNIQEGQPIGILMGLNAIRVLSADEDNPTGLRNGQVLVAGDYLVDDLNGDNLINGTDINNTIIGYAQPFFTGGFTNNFSYKNWQLNVFLQGTYGNDIFNASRAIVEGMDSYDNAGRNTLRRWRQQSDVTGVPIALQGQSRNQPQSRFIEDGSYLRVKVITLSYTLPKTLTDRIKMANLKVYVTGQNLLTFTNYSGWDPEVNTFSRNPYDLGIDYGSFPQARTVVVGLNVGF